MTISSSSSRINYTGNGSTTAFSFPYEFQAGTDLKVYKNDTLQTITTHYTVSGGSGLSGTVTFVTAPANGDSVVIYDDPPATQLLDYIANDPFPAESHEGGLDKLTRLARRLVNRMDRAMRFSDSYAGSASVILPTPEASKVLGWDGTASALINRSAADLITTAAFAAWRSQRFSGNGATTAFTLDADPGNVNNMDVSIGGVTQQNGIDFTVSGVTLTFTTAPASGTNNIFVRYGQSLPQAIVDSSAVTFVPPGTGAVNRTAQAKLREIEVSITDFGAVGDSNGTTGNGTDNTTAIQAAINYVKAAGGAYRLKIPEGIFRVAAGLLIDTPVSFVGEGTAPYVGSIGTLGGGSWLYFDHTGRGIAIDGPAIMSGIRLENIGTLRNQPAPGPGWAPTAHDFDIYIDNADVYVDELMLLNPTKGIFLGNGQAGRLTIGTLRGQPMQVGLEVDVALDVVSAERIHFWPFWRDNTDVHTYTMANLDAVYLKRCDNPLFTNLFSIFARSTIRCGQNGSGTVSKLKVTNLDCDRGKLGLWVDNTVTSGIISYIGAMTHQGETGLAGSKAVHVQGNSSTIEFGSLRTDRCDQNGVHIEGTGNVTRIGMLTIANYNQAAAGHAAVLPANGNDIHITYLPSIINGGAGAKYGSTGNVFVDEWRSYTPTITSGTGTITTLGTVVGRFKLYQQTLSYELDIGITTNGTAGSDIRATLPAAASSTIGSIGNGREQGVSGKQLQALVGSSSSQAVIYNYDGTYPGASGARLLVGGSFPLP